MSHIKSLSMTGVVAITVSWLGVVGIVFFQKILDPLVIIIAVASAYYLAKWVIIKGDNLLSIGDLVGILITWIAVVIISYFVQNQIVSTICIAAAYYLSKWIIRKEVEGPIC